MRTADEAPSLSRRSALATICVAATHALGCSADSKPAPEPDTFTPGAFLARESQPGTYQLFRTLLVLRMENGKSVMFMIEYSGTFPSLDVARERAQDPSLHVRAPVITYLDEAFLIVPVQVVWFRTLTEAEEDAYR